ncbi:Hypothetical_protein [Hexamita inflata]|uniref:Hypothetical_protein n=1 Tax=Hexamita inflata TaxID=28002 RepID=A0AA86NRW6_9EUKA|nr:Hypothetical protein HINF_LOCUS11345 [Hexamita inflata]
MQTIQTIININIQFHFRILKNEILRGLIVLLLNYQILLYALGPVLKCVGHFALGLDQTHSLGGRSWLLSNFQHQFLVTLGFKLSAALKIGLLQHCFQLSVYSNNFCRCLERIGNFALFGCFYCLFLSLLRYFLCPFIALHLYLYIIYFNTQLLFQFCSFLLRCQIRFGFQQIREGFVHQNQFQI